MNIIKHISLFKVIATLGALTLPSLHNCLIAVSSFTIPFSLAIMFDDAISGKFGLLIVIILGIYLVAWCVSQVLLRVRNATSNLIGLFCVAAMNLSDIICAVCSSFDTVSFAKVINIFFSAVILVLAWFLGRGRTGGRFA